MKLQKFKYKDVMREAGAGFWGPLMYKGQEVGLSDVVPLTEHWFITRQKGARVTIVKKVSSEQLLKMHFWDYWFIALKTKWLEFRGY